MAEKDASSIKSTSTITSMTSLLKSTLKSHKSDRTASTHSAETAAMKSRRKLAAAEAKAVWAMSR